MVADDAGARADPQPRRRERSCSSPPQPAGLRSMREDGERLVDEGITSPEEVHARDARLSR